MRRLFLIRSLLLLPFLGVSPALARPDAPKWPLTLRDGLPATLTGWAAAPTDPLPEEDENAMGRYTEVGRFFQKVESSSSTKQFRLSVQDYGAGRDLVPQLKNAFSEAASSGVETRSLEIGRFRAFVVTDRSAGKPTTIVTVIVSPSRLVLGQGANVAGDEALALVRNVDLARVAAAK
jgi:hypothetical protein